MIVEAQAGETVDALCWRVLGQTAEVTEATLQRNPGLSALGAQLPGGTMVDLPDPDRSPPRRATVKLWD